MLGMKTYPKAYVAACRGRVDDGLRAWRKLGKAPKELEHRFFADQVLVLDHMFEHRLRTVEGKDGNPLNEVRVLCSSLLLNDGIVQVERLKGWPESAPSGLKLPSDASVLGLENGDRIALTEQDFAKLADAFFAELEERYT